MKKLKFFFGFAGVMALLTVFLTNTALFTEKPIKWRLQGIHAQGSPICTTVEETCKLIQQMSNGRLEITPYEIEFISHISTLEKSVCPENREVPRDNF